MSTDPYPDVTADESGIVPPQTARPPEWPKKLRTLTAAELDRLTIDSSGRFYWDGKLVNYDTGPKQLTDQSSPPDSLDRSLEMLERTSFDLGGRKTPATIEGQLAEPAGSSAEPGAVDLDIVRAQAAAAVAEATMGMGVRSDRTHVKLSRGQTIGAVIVVLAMAIGAFSMATYGYVAARDWGCKTGAFKDGCPMAPVVKQPERPDIPA